MPNRLRRSASRQLKKKLSDFDKITADGSVQVSGAQISNFFEIGSLEPEIGTKTCPKMAHFLPKVKIFNFGSILLCFTCIMRFLWVESSFLALKMTQDKLLYPYPVYLGCIWGVFSEIYYYQLFISDLQVSQTEIQQFDFKYIFQSRKLAEFN